MTNKPASTGGKTTLGTSADERLDELRRDVDVLAGQFDSVLRSEDWIQAKLYDLNLSLAALVRAQPSAASEDEAASNAPPPPDPAYHECVRRIRETVRRELPRDATVVVVSKGDEGLLDLYGRRGWHFPRASNGEYLWYYPPDGPSVIAQIETLRIKGAQYLLFPEPALLVAGPLSRVQQPPPQPLSGDRGGREGRA